MSRLSESDLTALRRLAREIADRQGESLNTAHLLAAVIDRGGPAARLLEQRNLEVDRMLAVARGLEETTEDAIEESFAAARQIARRAAVPSREAFPSKRMDCRPAAPEQPGGVHVLLALLANRGYAAHRALVSLGTEIPRLRAAVTRIALGVVSPPRAARAHEEPTGARASVAPSPPVMEPPPARPAIPNPPKRRRAKRKGGAVEVPLVPPLRKAKPTAVAVSPIPNAPLAPPAGVDAKIPVDVPPPPAPVELSPAPAKALPAGAAPLDRETFPMLASIGRDLTQAARAGELEPVIGREREVEQALDILAKRRANNPVLTGPAGVGKTSVAHALADSLGKAGKRLIELPVAELLAGTGTRGSLAERLADVRAEVKDANGALVVFVDELHELLDTGDEAIAELKAALALGELPIVGATSTADFRRLVETDPALARRFTEVPVEEPSEADAFLLLRKVASALGKHHRVRFTDEAIAVSVAWSIRYLPGRALPDKAVSLLDLAGARRRRRAAGERRPEVDIEHVAEVVSEMAEVPVERLTQTDHERMLDLEQLLQARVIGHDEACGRIAAVLRRNAAGLRGRRPVGTFLLLGPTGVGKTETAKAVAEVLFGSPDAMTRLDMSEYAEAHAVARLIGAPPGYIGHDAGGLLTEAVRRRPYQVVLLDEIEKAHRDVLQAFLQVFDEGRLTDGRGRTVDLTNTVIVLTSNIGAVELSSALNERRVGFGARTAKKGTDALRDVAVSAARATLPPELYNRIDEVLFFRHLEKKDVHVIARRLLEGLARSLELRGIGLEVDDAAIDALLESGGFDAELGARPMRRAITRWVEAPLADMILRRELTEGSVARVEAGDAGGVAVRARAPRRRHGSQAPSYSQTPCS